MSSCFPSGQLFEVHGSKFKPHPVGNVGLTSVMGITHAMPLLGISKDPLMRIAPGILGCTWCRQPDPHSPSRCAAGQSSRSFWSGYIAAWWDIGRKIWGRCNTPGNRPGCWCGRTKPSIPGRSRSHNVHHRHTSTARAHPVSLWDACRRWTAPGHRQILFCRYLVTVLKPAFFRRASFFLAVLSRLFLVGAGESSSSSKGFFSWASQSALISAN